MNRLKYFTAERKMDASLNIAIAAEFDLCEKIAEALEQS